MTRLPEVLRGALEGARVYHDQEVERARSRGSSDPLEPVYHGLQLGVCSMERAVACSLVSLVDVVREYFDAIDGRAAAQTDGRIGATAGWLSRRDAAELALRAAVDRPPIPASMSGVPEVIA